MIRKTIWESELTADGFVESFFYTVIFRYTPNEVDKLKESVFVWKAPGFVSCNGFLFSD